MASELNDMPPSAGNSTINSDLRNTEDMPYPMDEYMREVGLASDNARRRVVMAFWLNKVNSGAQEAELTTYVVRNMYDAVASGQVDYELFIWLRDNFGE